MNIAKILLTKVGKVFLVILATFRRALCCIRRRRRNSDTPLPFTTTDRHSLTTVHPTISVHQFVNNEVGQVDWNSWGTGVSSVDQEMENPSSVSVTVEQKQETMNSRSNQSYAALRYIRQHSNNSETEPEVDFFQDMVPDIRRPAKIIIKKHDESSLSRDGLLSERLAVDPQLASGIGELGHWEETESTWEDSMDAETACVDTDSVLRETKLLERERRAADHLRRKQEKDAVRIVRKDHLATKIS